MLKLSALVLAVLLIAVPALAQTTDFSGEWSNRNHEDATDRIGGPPIGDYLGFALNDAGRMRAQAWDGGEWSLPEFQCRPHLAPYDWRAAGDLQIAKEMDPVSRALTAYHVRRIRTMDRTIYLDGRPHPPEYAAHTWEGFSTAFPDPVYLEEPWIFSVNYQLNIHTQLTYFPCTVIEDENITRTVPHNLPGKNPYLTEWLAKDHVPAAAAEGRRETLYPEYQQKMQQQRPSN